MPVIDLQQFLQKDEEETENLLISNLDQACSIASRMLYFDTSPCSNSIDCTTSANMSPILPKRAETFGGFDNSGREITEKGSILKRKLMQLKEMEGDCHGDRELSCSDSSLHIKPKTEGASNVKFISSLKSPENTSSGNASNSSFHSGYNRVEEVAELNHLLANVTSLLHHHLSIYRKEYGRRRYRPDHQLEELRNIQEKLSQERLQWEQEKAKQEKELDRKKEELLQMQKRFCGEQDINRLTCNLADPVCDHNCMSLGLCRHRRSASFDFRTLGNLTQDVGEAVVERPRRRRFHHVAPAVLCHAEHVEHSSSIDECTTRQPELLQKNSDAGADSRNCHTTGTHKNSRMDTCFSKCLCTSPIGIQ